jgi:ABC-type transporter Mla maintaining outer membrane lipid asymmetry permease subunit MlaE
LTAVKNKSTSQREHLPVIIINTIIGGVVIAISAVRGLRNVKAMKRLIEISRM